MNMLEWAVAYAQRGWPVFPLHRPIVKDDGSVWCSCGHKAGKGKDECGSAGKHPRTIRGLKEATTDIATIRDWWRRWPDANIGLPTGSISGLDAVDQDIGDGKDGLADWLELEKAYGPAPETLVNRTGSGGRQLLFKHVDGFKNSQHKIAPGIDTRGEGGYIVAPPSFHVAGRMYEWEGDPTSEPAIMPAWVPPLLNSENGQAGNLQHISKPAPAESRAFERCRAYLQCVPDAISGAGGHGATLRAACECFRFGLGESQAWDMLCWFNANKCQPVWTDRELRHKLKEGRKLVDREGKFGARLEDGAELIDWPIVYDMPAVVEVSDELQPEPSLEPKAEFPADLLEPPGLLGEVCRYMNDTAIRRQPILSLANAIAFVGAVVGRKVASPLNLRTNFYCLGVSASGSGKDHSRKCIKRICEEAGLTGEILGGEDISSDSAVLAAVAKHKSILFQLDEIGHFFTNSNSKFAATHMRNIAPTLTKLFSTAGDTYIGKEYANQERKDIEQPNVCIYGTTVAHKFFDGLTPSEVADGFLSRMLVFQSSDRPPIRDVQPQPVPPALVETVKAWFTRKDLPKAPGNLNMINIPITVAFDIEAQSLIRRFSMQSEERQESAERDGLSEGVFWTRAAEHAIKLAVLVACGCQFEKPVVAGEHAEYAIRLVSRLIVDFIHTVKDSIASNDHERDLQYLQRIIRQSRTISRTQLIQKTRRLTTRLRQELLAQLVESGYITSKQQKTGSSGFAATTYVWKSK